VGASTAGAARTEVKTLLVHGVAAVADMAHPGAGQLVHLVERAIEAVKTIDSWAKGDGVRPNVSLELPNGFAASLSVDVGADRPVMGPAVDFSWDYTDSSAWSVDIGLEAGEPADPAQKKAPEPDVDWYELEETPSETSRVRAGLIEFPPRFPAGAERSAAVIAIVAPSSDVLSGSGEMSPRAVVEHAARLGAIRRDGRKGPWCLAGQPRDQPASSRWRRRTSLIVYLDRDTGLLAVVELTAEGDAAAG
jgi:hypothetical protein